MRLIRFLRRHPITVFGLLAGAFVAWVCAQAFRDKQLVNVPNPPGDPIVVRLDIGTVPLPPECEVPSRPTPHDTAQALPKLKTGMMRTEVEGLVGAPSAYHPATLAEGRVTYHISYEADLAPVSTVRPISIARPKVRPAEPAHRAIVTLEFDATKPGHPLLGIHYPDPLF